MALIKCPYCGANISDKAHRCPKCGKIQQPTNRQNLIVEETNNVNDLNKTVEFPEVQLVSDDSKQRKLRWLLILIGGGLLIVILWLLFAKSYSSVQNNPAEGTTIAEETSEILMDTVVADDAYNTETTGSVEADVAEAVAEEEASLISDRNYSMQQGEFALMGKINDKYLVKIWLTIEDHKLSGKYCYTRTLEKYGDKPSTYIQINGAIDSDGNLTFTGSYSNSSNKSEWTGQFVGNRFYAKKSGKEEVMVAYTEE